MAGLCRTHCPAETTSGVSESAVPAGGPGAGPPPLPAPRRAVAEEGGSPTWERGGGEAGKEGSVREGQGLARPPTPPPASPSRSERVAGSLPGACAWVSEPRAPVCSAARRPAPHGETRELEGRGGGHPGRKRTYPRLPPDRGPDPGRGGAPRGGRGREARRAPEFGVKVGGGGSVGETEGEASSRCQAFTATGSRVGASPAAPLPRGRRSALEGRPQQGSSPGAPAVTLGQAASCVYKYRQR